jgi:hypothetical protein
MEKRKEPGSESEPAEPEGGKGAFRGKWPLPEGARPAEPQESDPVEEASRESFPASDPPAFTPSRTG